MKIEENVPLSRLTTFRTGGPARFLVTAESEKEIGEAVRFAKRHELPIIPLGSGSNLLPPDAGLNAVLVRYTDDTISVLEENDERAVVSVAGGASWDGFVEYAITRGWWGIENLSAIPGTVGAAIVQNIGAYGAAIGNVVTSVKAYDSQEETFKTFSHDECAFDYRMSVFKKMPDRYFITTVTYTLSKQGSPNLTYRDLALYFEKTPVEPTLPQVRQAVMEIRARKFPPLSDYGTAGSFFLNPVFTRESVKVITEKYPDIPVYELPEGGVKIPLAWIFDQVLKAKGRRAGEAFVWEKQPLVIATRSGATTRDVLLLARGVAKDFFNATEIKIFPEVRLFGDEAKQFE